MSDKISFEKAMERLEEVVKSLEAGSVPLDKSLELFEEGTALIKKCTTLLDEAEKKVVLLTKDENGEPSESEFVVEESK